MQTVLLHTGLAAGCLLANCAAVYRLLTPQLLEERRRLARDVRRISPAPTPSATPLQHVPVKGEVRGRLWYTGLVAGYLLAAYAVVHHVLPAHLSADVDVYVARPSIWGGLALLSGAGWWRSSEDRGLNRALIGIAFLAGVFQVAVTVVAGLLYGFGHSPYARQALSMAENGLYVVALLLGLEMSRAYLLQAWSRVSPVVAFAVVVLLYTGVTITLSPHDFATTERVFQTGGGTLLPAASESVMATFLAAIGGPVAALAYRLPLAGFEWFSPILPDLGWAGTAFTGTLAPALAMLLVRDICLGPKTQGQETQRASGVSPLWMLAAVFVVALIWLNSGLLGVRPAVISGVSMEPALAVGDVVFTREVAPEALRVGDVIRYRNGQAAIMHRIVEIDSGRKSPVFITKGDNNNVADNPVLAQQIEGKVVFTIPKAGWAPIYVGKLLNRFR